jgi:hypothetical protein
MVPRLEMPPRREGSLLQKESRELGVLRFGLKAQQSIHRLDRQLSLVPPAERIGHGNKYTLRSFDASLSR